MIAPTNINYTKYKFINIKEIMRPILATISNLKNFNSLYNYILYEEVA